MTLRDLVKHYREEHGMSQRQFASECGLSNGYISMLEKNENPKTGLPVTPSLPALKKLANGMHMTLTEVFMQAEDMPVDLLSPELDDNAPTPDGESGRGLDPELASLILGLSPEKQKEAIGYLRYLSERAEN